MRIEWTDVMNNAGYKATVEIGDEHYELTYLYGTNHSPWLLDASMKRFYREHGVDVVDACLRVLVADNGGFS